MNKELRKTIEAELAKVVTETLTKRDQKVASLITKHIRDGAKGIAKKFVKNLAGTKSAKTGHGTLKNSSNGQSPKKTKVLASKKKPASAKKQSAPKVKKVVKAKTPA